MEEEWEEMQPFWVESTTNHRRLFKSGLLLLLLVVTAVCFMVFIIPSVYSFRPNTVKKSWDSINVVLVLFAIIFGFLSRNRNDDDDSTNDQYRPNPITPNISIQLQKSNPHQCYHFSDPTPTPTPYNYPTTTSSGSGSGSGGLGLRRTSTSYPDLRESLPWVTGDDRWRSFDDTQIYRVPESDHLHRRRIDRQDSETKNVHVQTFVSHPPQKISHSPPPSVKKKSKRTFQSIGHEPNKTQTPPTDPPTPPPPPPPPSPPPQYWGEKSGKSDKKRGGTNATKDFLTALYHKNKKKRQRQRSVDNLDTLLNQSQPPAVHYLRQPPSVPPPPPPPPPPPSVFHNLFSSKKARRRNIPSAPPPPPPPFTTARASKPRTRNAPAITHKPLLPVKTRSFNIVEDNSSSGGESPLTGIPPPPPPPPFKMTDWKFAVQGDYVRILSNNSSRSGSPDLDDVESSPTKISIEASVLDGGETTSSPLFCPSPDVDTKADSFIAKFKAGLRLEKIDSFNQKQGLRMSNLGPGPGPSQI